MPPSQLVGAAPRVRQWLDQQVWLDGVVPTQRRPTLGVDGSAPPHRRPLDHVLHTGPQFGNLVGVDDALEHVEPVFLVGGDYAGAEAALVVELGRTAVTELTSATLAVGHVVGHVGDVVVPAQLGDGAVPLGHGIPPGPFRLSREG